MKKKTFSLTMTTTLAAALVACGPRPQYQGDWDDGYTQYADRDTAVCVDRRTGKRIDDSNCERGRSHGSAAGWYYVGRNSALPYHGDSVRGGTYTRPAGATFYHAPATTSMSRATAVSRGGFGSTGRSFASRGFSSGG